MTDREYRLTRTQQRIWTGQRLHPDVPLANMGKRHRITGALDAGRLVDAFADVVTASDALRTVVVDRPGGSVGRVLDAPPAATEVIDLDLADLDRWCAQRIATPIDARSCSYDSVVLRHGDHDWTWWLDLHHVVTDAAGSAVVFRSTSDRYAELSRLDGAELDGTPELELASFVDHVASIEAAATSTRGAPRREKRLAEWERRRRRPAPAPLAPFGGRAVHDTRSTRLSLDVDAATIRSAVDGPYRTLTGELSMLAMLAASAAVVMHRLDGSDEVTVGVPVHHRSGRVAPRVVGPLMELYPVTVRIAPDDTFDALVQRTLADVVDVLGRARPGESPDADYEIVVNVVTGAYADLADLPTITTWQRSAHLDPANTLHLHAYDYSAGERIGDLTFEVDVSSIIADGDAARRLARHLGTTLHAAAAHPDQPLADLDIVSADERRRIAALIPSPAAAPDLVPVHEAVRADLAARPPDDVVIIDGDESISAAAVEHRIDRAVVHLRTLGVGRHDRVGLRMARSADVLVAIQAVLRCGAAFVLLDPDDPPARHAAVAADADLDLILDSMDTHPAVVESRREAPTAVAAVSSVHVELEDLAYVLYTSGSTGQPKGVPISHRGLADYLRFAVDAYVDRDGAAPTVALHSSLVFDLTITSLFVPLLTAGRVVVVPGEPLDALAAIACDQRITFLKATPTQLELLARMVDTPLPLRTIVVGGEAFRRPGALAAIEMCEPGVRIFNEYGPTEAVVGCMIHRFDPDRDREADVPIGVAAPGCELAILDAAGRPSPPGAWGELFVRRHGMATGYLGRPELSAGRFVDLDGVPGALDGRARGPWYRTGDRVRSNASGVAVYGGRSDDQLKVSGIRLEPGEVEAALVAHPAIESAVVRLWQAADDVSATPMLTAWYRRVDPTADGTAAAPVVDDGPTPLELRAHLRERLAEHAVPTAYVAVTDMPLASSAKVDTAALPAPTRADLAALDAVAPRTDTERALCDLWRDVLRVADVGVHDDFFDLGGDSLAALEVAITVADRFGVDLGDTAVFRLRTVAALAVAIGAGDPTDRSIPPLGAGPLPLSAGEEAMLFEYRMDPDNTRYNSTRLYTIAGPVDRARLRQAIGDVVMAHPPLHTSYSATRRALTRHEASSFDERPGAGFRDFALAQRAVPFDLDDGPLVRVHVGGHVGSSLTDVAPPAATGSATQVLVGMHHICNDAVTFDVFWQQVVDRYGAGAGDLGPLPEPTTSYAAHGAWQRTDSLRHADHWRAERAAAHAAGPAAELALAAPNPPEPDGYLTRVVDVDAAALGVGAPNTPFVAALVAAAATVGRFSGSSDVELGISMSIKDHPATAPLVGYCLNTLPVRLRVDPDSSSTSLARAANAVVADAIEHRTYPFASIVRDARADRSAVPNTSCMLAYQTLASTGEGPLAASHEILASGTAIADVVFYVQERTESISLGVEYRGSAIGENDAHRLLDAFVAHLEHGVHSPDDPIVDLTSADDSDLLGAALPTAEPTVLHRLVERLVRHPDAVVCVDASGCALTTAELVTRALELADRLDLPDPSPEQRRRFVGVAVHRSVDVLVAMLAVQFAGGATVPLDPTAPDARLATIVDAAQPLAIICDDASTPRFDRAVPVGADRSVTMPDVVERARVRLKAIDPDDPAYVIFTSGSTGQPRGVVVSHANLAASTFARDAVYAGVPQRFLVTSSIGFDSSVVGLYWPLAAGGTVVFPSDDDVGDVDLLAARIAADDVTHVLMVPSLYRALLERCSSQLGSLRTAIVAGEAVTPPVILAHRTHASHVDLFNEYGPTEASVWATVRHVDTQRSAGVDVSIGRPIPGATIRVADRAAHPVPVGVIGELLVSGPTVTSGYLDDADATAARFVELDGRRWYRTGDLARVDAHGDLDYRGRNDDQLNVGGVRVEPTEIEAALVALDTIDDAVVVSSPARSGERQRLVALVTGTAIDEAEVRRGLASRLPAAQIPARVFEHASLPRTSHGKLDRRAASELAAARAVPSDAPDGAAGAPTVETVESVVTVETIVACWRDVLGRPDLDAHTDYFDAGGDSLAAVEIVTTIGERLGRDVAIADLLAGRTPAGFAAALGLDGSADAASDRNPVQQLVVFREGVADGPLLLFTTGWDDVFGYQALAQGLPDHITVLALTAAPGTEQRPIITTVDGLAAALCDTLDASPWSLAGRSIHTLGWSTGGVVAYDLAVRLRHLGHDVAGVVLVDTYFPGGEQHMWANRWSKYRSLLTVEGIPEIGREIKVTVVRRARSIAAAAGRRLLRWSGSPVPDAPKLTSVGGVPVDAYRYRPDPSDLDVTIYAASTTKRQRTVDGWRTVAPDIAVVPVDGRHRGFQSIMGADRVGVIADDLATRLR